VGIGDVGDPVTHRLIERVFEGFGAAGNGMDFGAQEFHSEDIQLLASAVFFTHIDFALESKESANGGGGDTVLTSAGLRDDSFLAHSEGEEGLTKGVIDLMSAGVIEVFPFDDHVQAQMVAEAAGFGDGSGTPYEFGKVSIELVFERGVRPCSVELFR